MAQIKITIGIAISMLKKCTNVGEWNNTREYLKENIVFVWDNEDHREEYFDALFSVIESTGFIVKVLNKDEYGIRLIEYYIRKNADDIINKYSKIVSYE